MKLKFKKKNIYIILGMIINICLGSIYSWSIFRKPLEEQLNISSIDSGFPFMVFLIAYSFTMSVAGNFIEKFSPRRMTLFGGIMVSLAWFLSSMTTDINMLTLTYGVLGGIGVGIAYGVPMAVSAKWFPDKKGFAVGLTLLGFGLSPFLTAPISRYLIQSYGVFSAFRILGVVFFFVIVFLAFPLRFPNKDDNIKQKKIKNQKKSFDLSLAELLKSQKFYVLWVSFVIGTFTGLMAIGISSPVAQEIIGFSSTLSASSVALFAIFNGIGRPVFGLITDKFRFKKAAIFSFVLIVIASVIMLNAGEGKAIYYIISFSLFWFIFGGWLAIAPTAVSSIFGEKNYARNYGFLFTAYGIGAILSSLTAGMVKDSFGSYIYVFYPSLISAVLGILILTIPIKKRKAR